MTKADVLNLLEECRDPRGEAHWQKLGGDSEGLASYGIGLTKLRAIANKIGRDHDLALDLWYEKNHDAKVVGLLIDEPKKLTREQIESQVEGAAPGLLSHVISSCDATLAKSPLAFEIAVDWMMSEDSIRRGCAYGLVYELSKNTRDARLTDAFFLDVIAKIRTDIAGELPGVRVAMGAALLGIGKRNKVLNARAIEAAREIGPIHFSEGDKKCEPMDVLKHLTSDYLQSKLGKAGG